MKTFKWTEAEGKQKRKVWVGMSVPMGTWGCCQQNPWERLQTFSMIQAKIKFVKESKYTWIISSFNHYDYYHFPVKSWPRVTTTTSLLWQLKMFELNNLSTKKSQQLLTSTTGHLHSFTYQDHLVQWSLYHLICGQFLILVRMVFSLSPVHSCLFIIPKLYVHSLSSSAFFLFTICSNQFILKIQSQYHNPMTGACLRASPGTAQW